MALERTWPTCSAAGCLSMAAFTQGPASVDLTQPPMAKSSPSVHGAEACVPLLTLVRVLSGV